MDLSHNVIKRAFGHVRRAKIQISLRIWAVWSEASPGVPCIAKYAKFLRADKEYSAQTVGAQADLNLRWAHMSEGMFSQTPAHFSFCIVISFLFFL